SELNELNDLRRAYATGVTFLTPFEIPPGLRAPGRPHIIGRRHETEAAKRLRLLGRYISQALTTAMLSALRYFLTEIVSTYGPIAVTCDFERTINGDGILRIAVGNPTTQVVRRSDTARSGTGLVLGATCEAIQELGGSRDRERHVESWISTEWRSFLDHVDLSV